MSEVAIGNSDGIWANLLKVASRKSEQLLGLKNHPDIDEPVKLVLARLTALGIETTGSSSGHLDKSGQLTKQPFITWSTVSSKATPIIVELHNCGTNILIPEEMTFSDGLSSHPYLDVHPFKAGMTWKATGLFEDGLNLETSTNIDDSLPGLWLNVQAVLNRYDRLGIQPFIPEDFIEKGHSDAVFSNPGK